MSERIIHVRTARPSGGGACCEAVTSDLTTGLRNSNCWPCWEYSYGGDPKARQYFDQHMKTWGKPDVLCRMCGDSTNGCGSCVRWRHAIDAAYARGFAEAREQAAKVADDDADAAEQTETCERASGNGENASREFYRARVSRKLAKRIRALEPVKP